MQSVSKGCYGEWKYTMGFNMTFENYIERKFEEFYSLLSKRKGIHKKLTLSNNIKRSLSFF
jgi:hypothetical protein